jgi:cytochrome oxidase Cu insertion factor (SCO1/SenC/PrrC family)
MHKNKITILILLAMCAAPIVLGTVLYLFFPSTKKNNYGTLVQPQKKIPHFTAQNQNAFLSEFKGKWILLIMNASACDEACVKRLYIMRQLRATQGKEANRIIPIWLISDAEKVNPVIQAAYNDYIAGVKFIRVPTQYLLEVQTWLNVNQNQPNINQNIYVLDPKQHLMMYYTPQQQQQTKGMIKDITKLLKWSSIG